MALADLLTQEIVIVRREASGDKDEFGNPIPTETLIETQGEVQQKARSEQEDQGETATSGWLLVLAGGESIDTGDAVIVNGQVFEVVGAPWPVWNPLTGEESHIEATLRRVASSEEGS